MRQNFPLLASFSGFMDNKLLQKSCSLTQTRQNINHLHCFILPLNCEFVLVETSFCISQSCKTTTLSLKTVFLAAQLALTKINGPHCFTQKRSFLKIFNFQDGEQINFVFEHVYKELIQV